jgi:hypothetical protein
VVNDYCDTKGMAEVDYSKVDCPDFELLSHLKTYAIPLESMAAFYNTVSFKRKKVYLKTCLIFYASCSGPGMIYPLHYWTAALVFITGTMGTFLKTIIPLQGLLIHYISCLELIVRSQNQRC